MQTDHRVYFQSSARMDALPAASAALVLTSPPYPMIAMWDEAFAAANRAVARALERRDGRRAFALMHGELDPVWREVERVLMPGGFACINIGDAARTLGDDFMLYPNHARIITAFLELGMTPLPAILWRKQTNAPNKFMGSGMYPAGAYVTLEHEYILIARKGGKREFAGAEEKRRRHESAIFWEERNDWYSDLWLELKGARQEHRHDGARRRSGAFPFELAYRLVCMFSVKGDTVVDPFCGTGTTLKAAAAAGRHSVGYEIDPGMRAAIFEDLPRLAPAGLRRVEARIADHLAFVERCRGNGRALKHLSRAYGFPVVTRQEVDLLLELPAAASPSGQAGFRMTYAPDPRILRDPRQHPAPAPPPPGGQLPLF